jgi:hypothetical protein
MLSRFAGSRYLILHSPLSSGKNSVAEHLSLISIWRIDMLNKPTASKILFFLSAIFPNIVSIYCISLIYTDDKEALTEEGNKRISLLQHVFYNPFNVLSSTTVIPPLFDKKFGKFGMHSRTFTAFPHQFIDPRHFIAPVDIYMYSIDVGKIPFFELNIKPFYSIRSRWVDAESCTFDIIIV